MKRLSDYGKSQKEAIEYRYKAEEHIMNLIATGNINEVKTIIEGNEFNNQQSKLSRVPSNPLRDRKNGLVIRNTFYRIAANKEASLHYCCIIFLKNMHC